MTRVCKMQRFNVFMNSRHTIGRMEVNNFVKRNLYESLFGYACTGKDHHCGQAFPHVFLFLSVSRSLSLSLSHTLSFFLSILTSLNRTLISRYWLLSRRVLWNSYKNGRHRIRHTIDATRIFFFNVTIYIHTYSLMLLWCEWTSIELRLIILEMIYTYA